MENLEIIISIASTALGLLITTVTFIGKFVTNAKAKKAMENIVKIGNAVIPYIEEAETFVHYTGEEKKQYVLTKANRFAMDNNIKFDEQAVSERIEELVTLTKQVNKRGSVSKGSSEQTRLSAI